MLLRFGAVGMLVIVQSSEDSDAATSDKEVSTFGTLTCLIEGCSVRRYVHNSGLNLTGRNSRELVNWCRISRVESIDSSEWKRYIRGHVSCPR